MKHSHFQNLLTGSSHAHKDSTDVSRPDQVRVQWDPERGPRLERLPYRSIQIGIPAALTKIWVEEWIESIEDVTEKARRMKQTLDTAVDVDSEKLAAVGLLPHEREYEIPQKLAQHLAMEY